MELSTSRTERLPKLTGLPRRRHLRSRPSTHSEFGVAMTTIDPGDATYAGHAIYTSLTLALYDWALQSTPSKITPSYNPRTWAGAFGSGAKWDLPNLREG